jgi:hypothetical protein
MTEEKQGKYRRNNQTVEQILEDMDLFDDDFMSKVFEHNIPASELLLQVLLEDDTIRVESVKAQVTLKGVQVNARSIRLDIVAKDGSGRMFNVEVQRKLSGASPQRARFHSSMIDSRLLKEKEDFKEIEDSYVIFICEGDKYRKGLPLYHVERTIQELDEPFRDGSHIIYVNGRYTGDDAIGKLIHDFKCKKADEIHYAPIADSVRYFKETEEGRNRMCEKVERYAEAYAKEYAKECLDETTANFVKSLMESMNISFEDAIKALKIDEKQAEELKEAILGVESI